MARLDGRGQWGVGVGGEAKAGPAATTAATTTTTATKEALLEGGAPEILEHLKAHGSRVVSNDRSGACAALLLRGSAPALEAAHRLLLQQRTSPYFTADGGILLL